MGLEARPSWDPEAPARGDTLSVQVTLTNVGSGASPAGTARVLLNGVEIAANDVPSLAPGRRTTLVARPASVGEGDTATLEVTFRAGGGEETLERRDVIVLASSPPPPTDPSPGSSPPARPASAPGPGPGSTPMPTGPVPDATPQPPTPVADPPRGAPVPWLPVIVVAAVAAVAVASMARRKP